jgi:hypothetical protein
MSELIELHGLLQPHLVPGHPVKPCIAGAVQVAELTTQHAQASAMR